jgi:hypothetical protein
MLLVTCLVGFTLPLRVSSLAQSNNANAIRTLVGRLFESYQQKDIDKLISFWSEKSPFLAENKKLLQQELAAYEKIALKGFAIRQMKIDGEITTLQVVAEMALTRANMVKAIEKIEKKNRTIQLVTEGRSWKVWKFILSEEELATAIIGAKTEEERRALMEKNPELITSDLASASFVRFILPVPIKWITNARWRSISSHPNLPNRTAIKPYWHLYFCMRE